MESDAPPIPHLGSFRPEAIGVVRSSSKTPSGVPIQPTYAASSAGSVWIRPEYRPALADIDGFERIWLVSWLHLAQPFTPLVVPFRDTHQRGCLATRVPSRPNPIGMSTVRLVSITDAELHVSELDLIDGTPILDIKPYVPEFDAYPGVPAGWFDTPGTDRTVADDRFTV